MDDELDFSNESEYPDGSSVANEDDADLYGNEAEEQEEEAPDTLDAEAGAGAGMDAPEAPPINLPMMPVDGDAQLFTEDEQEQLNEMVLNGQYAQAQQIVWARQQAAMLRTTQRLMQAQTVYGSVLTRAEQEFPEVFATHGNTIRQIAASASPELAGNPTTLFSAMIAPYILEVQAGADPIATAKRLGRMLTRQAGTPQGQQTRQTAASPPSARVAPSGSRSGSGGVPSSRASAVVRDMMELFGAEEGEVRRALDAAKGR